MLIVLKSLPKVFDPFLIPALVGVLSLVLSGPARSTKRHALIALTNRNPTTMNSFVDSVKGMTDRYRFDFHLYSDLRCGP